MKNKIIRPCISATKGHHPREKVLHPVNAYIDVMATILKAVHVRHKEHALAVRTALLNAAEAVFQHQMTTLMKLSPERTAELQKKVQFNDSVSRLRTLHNLIHQRINALTRPKKEEVYEPVPE